MVAKIKFFLPPVKLAFFKGGFKEKKAGNGAPPQFEGSMPIFFKKIVFPALRFELFFVFFFLFLFSGFISKIGCSQKRKQNNFCRADGGGAPCEFFSFEEGPFFLKKKLSIFFFYGLWGLPLPDPHLFL